MASAHRVFVASNRGPVEFLRDERGDLVARRGGGGLVTALTAAMNGSGGLWMASAMTRDDRSVAEAGRTDVPIDGATYQVRYLAFPPAVYDRFYNQISNRVLWFMHHFLWDIPRVPSFDESFRRSWEAYREVNAVFARTLDEEAGRGAAAGAGEPLFLVQDYHLSLVPGMLRSRRRDARILHFSHIPFAGASYFRILPRTVREEMLRGMLGADIVGFHDASWADNFLSCCQMLPGAEVDRARRLVRWRERTIQAQVYPISVDPVALRTQADDPEVTRAARRLERWRGDARMVLRVDRADLSKNILRGFHAYEAFLRRNPRWRGKVWFLALLQSSRSDLYEYRQYLKECLRAAGRVNAMFQTKEWEPIRVVVGDHYPTVLAAYQLYDVLLVNPVFDGMNLVAKEGPLLNRRDGVLVLSENAGASSELGTDALPINPFDVADTTAALGRALDMPRQERAERAAALRGVVERNTVDRWVRRQVADLDALRRWRMADPEGERRGATLVLPGDRPTSDAVASGTDDRLAGIA
jgi:trehalose 6-phosphate synthase